MAALKLVWNQLIKDLDKSPGWVPLLVTFLIIVDFFPLPDHVQLFHLTIPLSAEVLAGAATWLFYQFGDALDEWRFKTTVDGKLQTRPALKAMYKPQYDRVVDLLGVKDGTYSTALLLLDAARKESAISWVYYQNELAKWLRGLIVPFFLLAVYAALTASYVAAALSLVISATLCHAYPYLKVAHIRRVYSTFLTLANHRNFLLTEVNETRLIFWERVFVAGTNVRAT